MDILKPLGLAPEDVKLPLSPRSEDAYARINEEFDMLYSQLQDPGEQAGQNHAEVSSQAVWVACHMQHQDQALSTQAVCTCCAIKSRRKPTAIVYLTPSELPSTKYLACLSVSYKLSAVCVVYTWTQSKA